MATSSILVSLIPRLAVIVFLLLALAQSEPSYSPTESRPGANSEAGSLSPSLQVRDEQNSSEIGSGQLHVVAIGDSYAAGPSVYKKNNYDSNKDNCLRHSQAWTVEVATSLSTRTNLHYAACSGQNSSAAAMPVEREGKHGEPSIQKKLPPQLEGAGRPDVLLVQFGGNDVGFGKVTRYCFYDTTLPEYPHKRSRCTRELLNTEHSILHDLPTNLDKMWRQILTWPNIQGNQNLKIYQVGYPRFFANATKASHTSRIDDEEEVVDDNNFCNKISFAVRGRAKLRYALRSKSNELVAVVSKEIKAAIQRTNDPRVHYYDIDPLFEGKRFCEPAHEKDGRNGQYKRGDVWFWNWRLGRKAMTDELVEGLEAALEWHVVGSRPHPATRVFHPKDAAHGAIAAGVVAQIQQDGAPA